MADSAQQALISYTVAEALRDQGKMHRFELKAVKGRAVLLNTAVEIPDCVVAKIMFKFREAADPDRQSADCRM
jgi:hypothetical protein